MFEDNDLALAQQDTKDGKQILLTVLDFQVFLPNYLFMLGCLNKMAE